jgi:protocatechuate 3,4-dioxygenase beta subunit
MVFGQHTVSLRGAVTDSLGMPLEQATVRLGEKVQTVTDKTGQFTFNQIHPSMAITGYRPIVSSIYLIISD